MRPRISEGLSVRLSVHRSVGPSVTLFFKSAKTPVFAEIDGIELVLKRGDEGVAVVAMGDEEGGRRW